MNWFLKNKARFLWLPLPLHRRLQSLRRRVMLPDFLQRLLLSGRTLQRLLLSGRTLQRLLLSGRTLQRLLLSGVLLFSACDASRVFEENQQVKDNNWAVDDAKVFLANIDDTSAAHNVYINIRNAAHYPFSNIFLFLNTTFPGGQIDRDTLEIMLAGPDGKWLGEGLGDIWDNRILFKKNVSFPQKGEYRFEFTQAMRVDPLPGIMDVGIRIEKSQ